MWPVHEFQVSLPAHLHVKEDTDLLLIYCTVCRGRTWFSVYGVSLEALQKIVDEHRRCEAGGAGERRAQGTANAPPRR